MSPERRSIANLPGRLQYRLHGFAASAGLLAKEDHGQGKQRASKEGVSQSEIRITSRCSSQQCAGLASGPIRLPGNAPNSPVFAQQAGQGPGAGLTTAKCRFPGPEFVRKTRIRGFRKAGEAPARVRGPAPQSLSDFRRNTVHFNEHGHADTGRVCSGTGQTRPVSAVSLDSVKSAPTPSAKA